MNPENYSTLQTLTTLAIPVLTITSIIFVMFVADSSDLSSFTSFNLGEYSYKYEGTFEDDEEVDHAVNSDDLRNKKSLIESLDENDNDSTHELCDELIVSKVYSEYDY